MELQLLLFLTTLTASLGQLEDYIRDENCGKCARGSTSLTCPGYLDHEFELKVSKTSIKISCASRIPLINSTYLQGCEFPGVQVIWFDLCPLPDVSFGRFLQGIGINSSTVTHFKFDNHFARDDLVLRDDHFEGFENLKYIIMIGNNFQDFPASLLKNTRELENLILKDNNITTLSESLFTNTPKLKVIDFQGNGLSYLPENIFSNLTELTNITLFDNALSEIHPEIFGDLYNLVLIELAENNFRDLPPDLFINNKKLRTVSLRTNKLETLPESLFNTNIDLVQIRLNRNNLQTLPENIFKESEKVKILDISKNKISSLPPKIFQSLVELRNLSMRDNELESFPEILFSGLKNVLQIDMKHNLLHSLPQRAFYSTQNLFDLKLSGNRLTELPSRVFEKCYNLSELYISHNNLTSVPVSLFPDNDRRKLRKLDMSYNNLSTLQPIEIPDVFTLNPFSNEVDLELVSFAFNKFTNIPYDFLTNFLKLKKLNFRGNMIKKLKNVEFQSPDVTVDLRDNHLESFFIEINTIMLYKSLSESEEKSNIKNKFKKRKLGIYLSGNNLICDCFMHGFLRILKNETIIPFSIEVRDSDDVQCSGPEIHKHEQFLSLNSVDLTCDMEKVYGPGQNCTEPCNCFIRAHDHQHIMECSNSGLTEVPELPKIFINKSLTLNLNTNSITNLDTLLKPEYNSLSELNVAKNKLDHISDTLLTKKLKLLDISNNKITNISQAVADRWNNTNITVSLRGNPWACDCSLKPLYNFILEYNNEKILDFGSVYCAEPPEIENEIGESLPVKILDLRTDQFCPYALPLEVMVTLSVVIVITVAAAIIGTVVYYRNVEAIKVWLFSHRLCLCWITEEELDADKKYDAFISYSHKDEEFVNQLLVPGLESGDPEYRICLHYRDWVPGEYIQNQILSSVKASRRTIVVLSKNFIESVWGQMEFKAAHSQALQDNTNRIIVIVYGDVPPESSMDEELKMYISMKTYLKWGDTKFWERLRYAMPHPQYPINSKKRKRLNTDKIELCKSNSEKNV